jgi:hypothetical protein
MDDRLEPTSVNRPAARLERTRPMRRLFGIVTSVALLLAVLAPTALAAEPVTTTGSFILSANGTLDVPAGSSVDTVLVIDGGARIAGDVGTLIVAGGSATVTDATIDSVFVADGSVDLGAGSVVTGDVRTLNASVTQSAGATVQGSTRALDADLAALAILMLPLMVVFAIGFAIAAIAAGLLVAAFGARQVRGLETLIERQPGQVLVAGILGSIALPVAAVLLIMTVVGAPIGFGLLFLVLPVLAFLGWIVAAIWLGDWLLGRMRGTREAGQPYLAAVVGVIVLGLAGMLPFVSTVATLFGFGAIVLAMWRMIRPAAPATTVTGTLQAAPLAS